VVFCMVFERLRCGGCDQGTAIVDGILACGVRQFVDEAFEKKNVGMATRGSPSPDRYPRLDGMDFDTLVGDAVRQQVEAPQQLAMNCRLVLAVLSETSIQGVAHGANPDRGRLPVGPQGGPQPGRDHRMVLVGAANVLLAR